MVKEDDGLQTNYPSYSFKFINSFKSANLPQNNDFFEQYLCRQPTKCRFPNMFVINNKQILKVVGPLAEKFKFFVLLGIQIDVDLITQTQESSSTLSEL